MAVYIVTMATKYPSSDFVADKDYDVSEERLTQGVGGSRRSKVGGGNLYMEQNNELFKIRTTTLATLSRPRTQRMQKNNSSGQLRRNVNKSRTLNPYPYKFRQSNSEMTQGESRNIRFDKAEKKTRANISEKAPSMITTTRSIATGFRKLAIDGKQWEILKAKLPEELKRFNIGKLQIPDVKNKSSTPLPKSTIIIDKRSTTSSRHNTVLPTYNINLQKINSDMYVYSVYLDERKAERYLRIVLIGKQSIRHTNAICKFFSTKYNNNNTIVSPVTLYETCENHGTYFSSFIGSCLIPEQDVLLRHVIIAVNGIDLITDVIYNGKTTAQTKNLAVCVPPLFGNITVLRLTEFIELSQILGVEHFVFYTKFVSSDIALLLEYYSSIGAVTVMPWNLTIENIWYHGQSASVWDCLYRTMFKFKHVAFIDVDEFIIPRFHNTLPELISYLHSENLVVDETASAYAFKSAFFDSNFPGNDTQKSLEEQQFVTLNTTMRTEMFSNIRKKLVVNPVNVFELGIHHVSKPNEEHYQVYEVDTSLALIHHYRKCKTNYGMNCQRHMKDTTAQKYKPQLVDLVKQRLFKIRFHKLNN